MLLAFMWLQSASILTKSFNCNLLDTYTNKKIHPVVESLDDIDAKENLRLIANQAFLRHMIRNNITWLSKLGNILKRIESSKVFKTDSEVEFQSNYFSAKNLLSMIKGETILIGHTILKDLFLQMNYKWSRQFFVSSHKYVSSYSSLYVMKTHFLSRQIDYL